MFWNYQSVENFTGISFEELFSEVYNHYVKFYNQEKNKIIANSRLASIQNAVSDQFIKNLRERVIKTQERKRGINTYYVGISYSKHISKAADDFYIKNFERDSKTSYEEEQIMRYIRIEVEKYVLTIIIEKIITSSYPPMLQYYNQLKPEEKEKNLKMIDKENPGHIHRRSQIIGEYNRRKSASPEKNQVTLISEVVEWYMFELTDGKAIDEGTIRYYLDLK